MTHPRVAVSRSEAIIDTLKEGAVEIEVARSTALQAAELFNQAGDVKACREVKVVAGELVALRTRMEKLLEGERTLLKHLQKDVAALQNACQHSWKNVATAPRCRHCNLELSQMKPDPTLGNAKPVTAAQVHGMAYDSDLTVYYLDREAADLGLHPWHEVIDVAVDRGPAGEVTLDFMHSKKTVPEDFLLYLC